MADQINKTPEQRRIISGRMLLLCLSGLLINTIFAHMARMMALPLYLDNIGSALAAALGGYIPGIIVGFLTNLINGIWDYTSIYYGSLTILIAVASAWFAGKKCYSFQRPWRLLAVIAVFALIGGGLGSVLTWFLYGFSFASGISAPLALRLFSGGITNEFLAQLAADLLVDLADKSITVFIVALSFSILPASLRESLYSAGWQQTPMSRERRIAAGKKRARIVSLRMKLIALVISGMAITAAALAAISFVHFNVSARREQENLARGVASVASDAIDGNRVDEYTVWNGMRRDIPGSRSVSTIWRKARKTFSMYMPTGSWKAAVRLFLTRIRWICPAERLVIWWSSMMPSWTSCRICSPAGRSNP